MCVEIPLPITYNPYKHHLRFLLAKVETWRKQGWKIAMPKILTIGSNLVDLYTGKLSVSEVCNECIAHLDRGELLDPDKYNCWLSDVSWRKITLSDNSEWLLKIGDHTECFVHIHPAKYSIHSIRVRSTTLKTALAIECTAYEDIETKMPSLELVNRVRVEKLALSPVKSLPPKKSGILRLLALVHDSDF